MDTLRKPFFIATMVLLAVVVLMELGVRLFPSGGVGAPGDIRQILDPDMKEEFDNLSQADKNKLANKDNPPGVAIPAMAFVDGILLFTILAIGLDLFTNQKIPVVFISGGSCLFSFLLAIAAIASIFVTIALVLLMVGLLLAVPFGTIVYLAIYGFFNRGGASAALGLILTLKLAAGVCLLLAQQRFLQSRSLILLFLTSLVCNVVVSFLHGFVPIILVSITDGIGAIILAILAVIWALFLGIGSLIALIKILRLPQAKVKPFGLSI